MRKDRDGGEMGKKKIKTFLVATNVVASRLPECRPTGTPSACAKRKTFGQSSYRKNDRNGGIGQSGMIL